MRDLRLLDMYRLVEHETAMGGNDRPDLYGWFAIPSPTGGHTLRVLATVGYGWDHVSVSLANRSPNWPEMAKVASLFFKDDEYAMQLHVPASEHINNHPHVLHWWRPCNVAVPTPPPELVGYKGISAETMQALTPGQREILRDAALASLAKRGLSYDDR